MLKIWDTMIGDELISFAGSSGQAVAFSPDGRRVLSGGGGGVAKVWDASNGALLLTLTGHDADITNVSFSPDGQRMATARRDKSAKIWDARTGKEFRTLRGHTGTINSMAFSPDSQRLVTGSEDRTAKLWDLGALPLRRIDEFCSTKLITLNALSSLSTLKTRSCA